MIPYKELTDAGKLRRLRNLAITALECYELAGSKLSYYSFSTNLLYQVITPCGEHFMLRLASPGWRTYEDLCSEAIWLDALYRETTIPATRIIPAHTGEFVLPLSSPDVPVTWNASLMTWVPGRLLGYYLTEENLEKMGALFAALHQHGAEWLPPAGFTTRRFEHWLSREEENLITENGRAAVTLPLKSRKLLEHMHQKVESAYTALDRADLRVIHCDLWHDNIKLYRGVLHPFDFEDTVWGFRAHDIAMGLLDLLEITGEARYTSLLAAFRRGYECLLAWPDALIEPFQIGRLLWMINWVARCEPVHLADMVEQHIPVFEHYEQSGRVILPKKV